MMMTINPLISILLVAVLAGLGWMMKRLLSHDNALAVLVAQVNPSGGESLRELLSDLTKEVAVLNERTKKGNTP